MVYAIWAVGFGKPWAWAPRLGHYYRTAGDLGNRWGQEDPNSPSGGAGIMYNYDIQQAIPGISAIGKTNGSFPFLDELMVGMPRGIPHGQGDIGLTEDEARTHFAIWCMMASPLWITHNIFKPNITGPDHKSYNVNNIVAHDEALAINQVSRLLISYA
jgi:alpha-galactosidase